MGWKIMKNPFILAVISDGDGNEVRKLKLGTGKGIKRFYGMGVTN